MSELHCGCAQCVNGWIIRWVNQTCPCCNGDGKMPNKQKCDKCKGSGVIIVQTREVCMWCGDPPRYIYCVNI